MLLQADDTKVDKEDVHRAYLDKIRQRWLTVEPIVVIYMVGYIALLPIVQQYMYRRLAVDFNITDSSNANKSSKDICLERVGNSSELSGNEKDFQDSVSFWNTLVVALGLLPTIIVVIFIGAISDAWGRKFGLVPQLGAAVLSGIIMLLVVALDLKIVILPVIQFLSGMTGELIRVLPWDIYDDVIKWKHFPRNWPFVRGIHPVPGEFPAKRPVTRSFDIFFDLRLNKRLSKQS